MDLNQRPDDRGSRGFERSPRLKFVPPPELPTPEYATLEARAKALAIDALVWLAGVVLLAILFGGISSSNGLFWIKVSGPPILMSTVLWLTYMTLMESRYGGSIGKRARGIRVVMEDGEPVTAEAALIRNLMRFLDAVPYVVPYLVGAIAISNSPTMQRFGDRTAETIVVAAVPAPSGPGEGLSGVLPQLASSPPPTAAHRRRRLLMAVVAVLVVVAGAVGALVLTR
jgi:uncharacterized RDD family membrane protein YckC